LSWQVLWQLDLSLSLGTSAKGTALTVAVVMTGLALGARLMGQANRFDSPRQAWRWYGVLELATGLLAMLPRLLKTTIEKVDVEIITLFTGPPP
jgi:hypothetical protein